MLIYRCYAINNDTINAELSAKVDAMTAHVQQVLNLLQSEQSGITSSSSRENRDVGNLEVALQSTATLVTTAASIIETELSQSGSRGTASISGKPHQHISIAERIAEALSEEVSTEMKDGTPKTESSGSGVQGDTEYHFTRSSTKCDQVTIVWDIKDDRYNIVARIELHISIKPVSLYLYRNYDGVHAHNTLRL